MNQTLATLCDAYLEGGTGSVALYYSFDSGSVSSVGAGSNYTGTFLNESPSFSVGSLNGLVMDATGSSANAAQNLVKASIENDSFNLASSNIKYGGFSGISFLRPEDLDSEFCYLFSFRKTHSTNGVLFGSLVKDSFDNGIVNFSYGRGFNVGVNDRNKLFFQGSDSNVGDYILTAESLELGTENICSLKVSPYEVTFAHYNLEDDEFNQEYLRSNSKIQNNSHTEPFYIGGSPTFLKSGKTFSGYIDNLMIISGSYNPSDLKAVSSGFVATGIPVSGASFSNEIVTGHSVSLITPSGVTGYQPVITGYLDGTTTSDLIQFVLTSSSTGFSDGTRLMTGYVLPNGSGSYLEETSYLYKTNIYRPTGDDAFATLGLTDSGAVVDSYSIETTRVTNIITGSVPLYKFVPITGILLSAPTGYSKTILSTTNIVTGDSIENLGFIPSYKTKYKKDYLYFLERRL